MVMIKHFDFNNIIDVDKIMYVLESPDFPWFFQGDTTNYGLDESRLDKNTIQNPQLCHSFYNGKNSSEFTPIAMPILSNIDVGVPKKITRIKSNLNYNLTNYTKDNHQNIHADVADERGHLRKHTYMSLLYYVNDSDGDTKFFNKDKIFYSSKPKKGTALLFNSEIEHAGSNPINTTHRMVINFIFRNVFDIDQSLLEYKSLTENNVQEDYSYDHNKNVFDILKSLNLNDDVCLAGLYHSIYLKSMLNGMNAPVLDFNLIQNCVTNKIGSYAESLVNNFCNIKDRDNAILEGSDTDLQYIAYANLLVKPNKDNETMALINKYELKLGIVV